MRICKSKADLKNSTKVEVSSRNTDTINCIILDGCVILWCVAWPISSPTSQALLETMWNPSRSTCSCISVWVTSILYLIDTLNLVRNVQQGKPGALVVAEHINYLPILLFLLRNKFLLLLKIRNNYCRNTNI